MTTSQGVLGIDHVQVAVPPGCEEECRAFYVRVLGLPELPKPPALAARGGIWVQAGTHELHCGVDQDFQPARKAHPAFAVADIAALAARIDVTGYGVAWDRTNPAVRRFFTHDPFGNRLEFVAATVKQAAFGESVLGRYAVAEVEERIESMEKRLRALEKEQR